jgi:hypothetical protein
MDLMNPDETAREYLILSQHETEPD